MTAAPTPGAGAVAPSLLAGPPGPGAHSVGEGPTVTAAPTPDRDLLSPRWERSRAFTASAKG